MEQIGRVQEIVCPEEFRHLDLPQKVAAIRYINVQQRLPEERPERVLFNGAFFEGDSLQQDLFTLPDYQHFEHPLADHPECNRAFLLKQYGIFLCEINKPRATFLGTPGHEPGNLSIVVETKEVNLAGYWTHVSRTIFLDEPRPRYSLDIVSPSTVLAPPDHNNQLRAPDGIIYNRPGDLRP
jgi:hypothetical protein